MTDNWFLQLREHFDRAAEFFCGRETLAGVLARGETVIRNAGVVAVSYPWFWRDLGLVSGRRSRPAGSGPEGPPGKG